MGDEVPIVEFWSWYHDRPPGCVRQWRAGGRRLTAEEVADVYRRIKESGASGTKVTRIKVPGDSPTLHQKRGHALQVLRHAGLIRNRLRGSSTWYATITTGREDA